jgi:hypothetical protein
MKMPIGLIPTNIVDQYQLLQLVRHGFDYIKIQKGMYGLPQSSPANSFQNGWPSIAMLQLDTRTACGKHHTHLSCSCWLLKTLVYNMLAKPMPSTCTTLWKSTMKPPVTGRAHSTVALPWTGTLQNTPWTCPCQATSPPSSTIISMQPLNITVMHLHSGQANDPL